MFNLQCVYHVFMDLQVMHDVCGLLFLLLVNTLTQCQLAVRQVLIQLKP